MTPLPLAGGAAALGAVSFRGFSVESAGLLGMLLTPAANCGAMAAILVEVGGRWLCQPFAAASAGNEHGVSIPGSLFAVNAESENKA